MKKGKLNEVLAQSPKKEGKKGEMNEERAKLLQERGHLLRVAGNLPTFEIASPIAAATFCAEDFWLNP